MSGIRVAMLAPPWLPIPPSGYGGIENVLYALIPELIKLGVTVELFTVGETQPIATKQHWLYEKSQQAYIHLPQYDVAPITVAHMLYAINTIRDDGKFDVIHDHNNHIGPLALSGHCEDLPPAIHTLHNPRFTKPESTAEDIPDTLPMWQQLAKAPNLHFVSISNSLIKNAPKALKSQLLPTVHNGIDTAAFPFRDKKDNYFITLARFSPEKGQAIAIRTALELEITLKMAGVVADLKTTRRVLMELANPLSHYRGLNDFRYFSDEVFPELGDGRIDYVGEVTGERKLDFISHAKALLFPIQWDEPFGMAVIEALACGTPVVAMAYGAMPEIILHGVNGFLAKNEKEFKAFTKRIDEIDPAACRKSVEDRFSAKVMAENYLERYKTVIAKHRK